MKSTENVGVVDLVEDWKVEGLSFVSELLLRL